MVSTYVCSALAPLTTGKRYIVKEAVGHCVRSSFLSLYTHHLSSLSSKANHDDRSPMVGAGGLLTNCVYELHCCRQIQCGFFDYK